MILVKTYLDKSKINGIGLFAAEYIPKGTVIWDYHDGYDLSFKEAQLNDFLKKYCYKDIDKYILCVDDARFMNHSDKPNTVNGIENQTIASRYIVPGEEITCDYFDIDDAAVHKFL